jgi:photosystem II stability/assembly factor-like uncharacterized protein
MLAVGDGGFATRSIDDGTTWSPLVVPGSADLLAVTVDPEAHVALVADSAGRIWSTVNEGETFTLETTASGAVRSVSITDDGARALAVGDAGNVLARDVTGAWSAVNVGTSSALYATLILDGDTAEYVAGEAGTILQSVDRGSHWSPAPVTTTATIYGMEDL